ncbi:MAG: DUF2330 domain-containing protein [Myxococcales bacterium]|nr:MAG: DUF2330 domain-containing protein [Myxococcales bacterium]
MSKKIRIVLMVAATLAMVGLETAYANGGYFGRKTVASERLAANSMGAQQAFLLRTDDAFTLYLQSSVVGNLDDFGWILPLPAEPTEVREGPPDLFRMLDDMTAPRIILYKEVSHEEEELEFPGCQGSESAAVGDGGGLEAEIEESSQGMVEVLGAGVVGDFSYEILSAEESDALTDWLARNDYEIPVALYPLLADYVEEGFLFLAAKARRDVDPQNAAHRLPPMAITFPRETPMIFPMRLTALSAGERVPVLLYAAARSSVMLADGGEWREAEAERNVCSIDEYKQILSAHLRKDPCNLAIQYRLSFDQWHAEGEEALSYYGDGMWDSNLFYRGVNMAGYDAESWSIISSMVKVNDDYYDNYSYDPDCNQWEEGCQEGEPEAEYGLTRWYGELSAEAMRTDILIKAKGENPWEISPDISRNIENCDDGGGGCRQVGAPWLLLSAPLILHALLRRRAFNRLPPV